MRFLNLPVDEINPNVACRMCVGCIMERRFTNFVPKKFHRNRIASTHLPSKIGSFVFKKGSVK